VSTGNPERRAGHQHPRTVNIAGLYSVAQGDVGIPFNRPASASDLGNLPQRHSIHAITQTARLRPIREDVAQVGVTGVANGFDALQERRPIKPVSDDILLDRLGERRPTGMGLEFSDASNRTVSQHRQE
jgi:hypothetical protein